MSGNPGQMLRKAAAQRQAAADRDRTEREAALARVRDLRATRREALSEARREVTG